MAALRSQKGYVNTPCNDRVLMLGSPGMGELDAAITSEVVPGRSKFSAPFPHLQNEIRADGLQGPSELCFYGLTQQKN